ncbi:LysE family transporter [Candidatus Poribacteria bacterium]|nr:LysE family transporter [Candidatus Poribacteria bacterium]
MLPATVPFMLTSALLIQAYAIGWVVAAPIGPVNLEIIRRALRHRLLAGFLVGAGATMIDAMYMLLTGFGLVRYLQHRAVLLVTLTAGGAFMGWLAWGALRESWQEARKLRARNKPVHAASDDLRIGNGNPEAPRRVLLKSWLVGLAMTVSNPMTIVFWATLPGLLFKGVQPTAWQILAAAALVWLGTISWVSLLMVILAISRRAAGPKLFAIASGLGGLAMAYFALRFLWLALHIEEITRKFTGG